MLFGTILFWLPAIASACSMILLEGGIAAQPRIVPLWFIAALLAQFFCAVYSAGWIAGILLQTVLALYLMARMKLER
jgi:hypothetical protein